MSEQRKIILDANEGIRRGSINAPRKLDEGYVAFRIPEQDFKVLRVLYPDLVSKDNETRLKAWKRLEASAIGERYRVTARSPQQVRRASRHGNKGIIVK